MATRMTTTTRRCAAARASGSGGRRVLHPVSLPLLARPRRGVESGRQQRSTGVRAQPGDKSELEDLVMKNVNGLFGNVNEGEAGTIPDAEGYVDGTAGAFTITRVSFGNIALSTGSVLLAYGFGAYFNFLPGESISAIMLIYGFPASLIGFALRYAQLNPVPCRSKPEAIALRASKATDIQNQIREDVTRFRYGDEQHLDLALERVLMLGRYEGVPRRLCPKLVAVREEVSPADGEYQLVLEFEHLTGFKAEEWTKRLDKITSFFGPGIQQATMVETAQGAEITLTSDGSGAGRGGGDKKEVLPPLMPGLPAREA